VIQNRKSLIICVGVMTASWTWDRHFIMYTALKNDTVKAFLIEKIKNKIFPIIQVPADKDVDMAVWLVWTGVHPRVM